MHRDLYGSRMSRDKKPQNQKKKKPKKDRIKFLIWTYRESNPGPHPC
jgi:hypothetical protein